MEIKMPTMTECIMNGNTISISKALTLRDQADNRGVNREDYLCTKCHKPVRAHKSGGSVGAHFEHHKRNPDCPFFKS